MKTKGVIFILLFVMAINSLSLQQLFKIPVLISHFFEHQQRNESITFMDYLSMHYWGSDIDDNDHDRDMQLPFKKGDLGHSFQTFFIEHRIELVVENFPSERSYGVIKSQNHTSSHFGSLFKPPRLA